MSRIMRLAAVLAFAAAVAASVLFHRFNIRFCLTLTVTFGTAAYHLGMRLVVGSVFKVSIIKLAR